MAEENTVIEGHVETSNVASNIATKLGDTLRTALFQLALANLQWSRGYLWYVELDDVPPPFHRNGVLGLPVVDVNYVVSDGTDFTWESGLESFSIPLRKNLCTMNLTMYDDEQGTIFTFFERWYNSIYDSRLGVLPITEAAKAISIYKLTTARNKITRHAYNYDKTTNFTHAKQTTPARDLLVYPKGPLQEQEKIDSNPRTYQVELVIVDQLNPDKGNPSRHEGELF